MATIFLDVTRLKTEPIIGIKKNVTVHFISTVAALSHFDELQRFKSSFIGDLTPVLVDISYELASHSSKVARKGV